MDIIHILSQEEENSTHFYSPGSNTMNGFLKAQLGLILSIQTIFSLQFMTVFLRLKKSEAWRPNGHIDGECGALL